MAGNTGDFHAPGTLAGTLAAYEARRQSLSRSSPSRSGSISQDGSENQSSDAVYSMRYLPSVHFLRWRPMYHLQAPSSWMNDPCAPGWDSVTGLYHLFFQWNPRRNVYGKVAWGSIAWGHATSKDMIHWTVSRSPVLTPGGWYDQEGCFTGSMWPTGLDGSPGQLTIFYTGVSRLPLHYSIPYTIGTETLAVAQSSDGGTTWTKMNSNPIHPEPPIGLSVSGWRDPYVAPWPSIDRVLGRHPDENTLYGVISGGIKGKTPTVFLYAVNKRNLAQWIYISSLNDLGLNHNISRWSGDMGVNWECANFMTLSNGNVSREFIVVGGEGSRSAIPDTTFAEYPQQATKFPRTERSLQWMSGSLHAVESAEGQRVPRLEYRIGGRFDHGCLYAINSFKDPRTSKVIAWGWITEEDLPQKLIDRQNWSGMISLPRQLSLQEFPHVTGALVSRLQEITSIEIEPEAEDTFTVRTLKISPAEEVELLRKGTREIGLEAPHALTSSNKVGLDIQTCRFELAVTFDVSDSCARIGFSIFHTPEQDPAYATTVHLVPSTETLTIERPDSSHLDPNIHTAPEVAPFTLFTFRNKAGLERESLQVRAWFDESVLEIFANERCTFATRVYPPTKRCWGIQFWAEDESQQSKVLLARAWDGLRADIRVLG